MGFRRFSHSHLEYRFERWYRDDYPHTRVNVALDPGLSRALELRAFLEHVPYKRYQH